VGCRARIIKKQGYVLENAFWLPKHIHTLQAKKIEMSNPSNKNTNLHCHFLSFVFQQSDLLTTFKSGINWGHDKANQQT
jgi:hypothetical protein